MMQNACFAADCFLKTLMVYNGLRAESDDLNGATNSMQILIIKKHNIFVTFV